MRSGLLVRFRVKRALRSDGVKRLRSRNPISPARHSNNSAIRDNAGEHVACGMRGRWANPFEGNTKNSGTRLYGV